MKETPQARRHGKVWPGRDHFRQPVLPIAAQFYALNINTLMPRTARLEAWPLSPTLVANNRKRVWAYPLSLLPVRARKVLGRQEHGESRTDIL